MSTYKEIINNVGVVTSIYHIDTCIYMYISVLQSLWHEAKNYSSPHPGWVANALEGFFF